MAKIVGIQHKVRDDGRDSYTYYFVSKVDNVTGYYTGSVWSSKEYINDSTKKPVALDDELPVTYRTYSKDGVTRNYFAFGNNKTF